MEENGLEEEKMNETEKQHPGFSDCVLKLASNPDAARKIHGKDLEKRARGFLDNMQKKAGIYKKDVVKDLKDGIGGRISNWKKMSSQQSESYANIENSTNLK